MGVDCGTLQVVLHNGWCLNAGTNRDHHSPPIWPGTGVYGSGFLNQEWTRPHTSLRPRFRQEVAAEEYSLQSRWRGMALVKTSVIYRVWKRDKRKIKCKVNVRTINLSFFDFMEAWAMALWERRRCESIVLQEREAHFMSNATIFIFSRQKKKKCST